MSSASWSERVRGMGPAAQAPRPATSLAGMLNGSEAAAPPPVPPAPVAAPSDYQALQLMRTGDPALALVIRTFHPRFQTPERYLMPYPQLLHVYALGDDNVTLQFGSMAFSVQGTGIADPILEAINDRSLKGLQQWHAARWPAPGRSALTINTIVAIDPQTMMQGRDQDTPSHR